MPLSPIAVEKIDFGPCKAEFDNAELGRTKGETVFNYSIETHVLETEEDGKVDEIVIDDPLLVTVPLLYTDPASLVKVIPWGTIDAISGVLKVGKAIGTRLSQFAKELTLTPLGSDTKVLKVYKCYPKPGPINFAYSRTGERIANVQFVAIPDSTKTAGEDYFEVAPVPAT